VAGAERNLAIPPPPPPPALPPPALVLLLPAGVGCICFFTRVLEALIFFFPLLLGFDIESERKRKEEQYFLFLGLHFCGNKESMELDL
jgi:hypothetical protein